MAKASYRKLRNNSMAAMSAAIEIYNKPKFAYRDPVFVILLVNAWELLLKATLSKGGFTIYYRKQRGKAQRTLSLTDALQRSQNLPEWPTSCSKMAIRENLEHLVTFRDNAVHFYNDPGFAAMVHSLAQTSVFSYLRFLEDVFGEDLSEQLGLGIAPLTFHAPIDPIEYFRTSSADPESKSKAVAEFMAGVQSSLREIEASGEPTDQFLTVYRVSLESVKKVTSSDFVVGVQGEASEQLLVRDPMDPNKSHPLRQTEVLQALADIPGFNSYTWQAVVWHEGWREKARLAWKDDKGGSWKWSHDAVAAARKFTPDQLDEFRSQYKLHMRKV